MKFNLSNEYLSKFEIEKLLLKSQNSWLISLRTEQITLGSLVLTLNRKCEVLSQLSKQEGEELANCFNIIEEMYQKTFQPDKVNYLALMMVDHQVHFHVIPRYSTVVEFNEKKFEDHDWPGPPNLKGISLSENDVTSLLNIFKNNI